jgi:hypothetical protein
MPDSEFIPGSLAQPSTRTQHSPSRNFEKLLTAYATAATATAFGLAFVPCAQADVIFTPTNQTVVFNKTKLDLNNDGIPDFGFVASGLGHVFDQMVWPFKSNQVWGRYFATALPPGVTIGPDGRLAQHFQVLWQTFTNSEGTNFIGQWQNVSDKFMGLSFKINGETHFGWARMSVSSNFVVTLTGYAYESTANTPLVTGITHSAKLNEGPQLHQQKSSDQQASLQAPTLGLLARGADGIAIWRREDES